MNDFGINGLQYIENFINQEQHDWLLEQVDLQPWCTDLKRRTQHYGYKYDYRSKSINESMRVEPLPEWSKYITELLYQNHLIKVLPDQLIVNEYQPGQGIANHIDCVPCFGDTVVSLSLGSQCIMELGGISKVIPIVLKPSSVLVLESEARFKWTHGIPACKWDTINGMEVPRKRRVSLTFRTVLLN